MAPSTDDLWRAHQAAQRRKYCEIEITQRVLDLERDALRAECMKAGVPILDMKEETLRRRLTELLLDAER